MDCFVAHMKGVSGVCPGCSSDHEHGIHNIQSPPEVVVKLTGDCTSSVRALLASNMCSCTIMLIILHQVADFRCFLVLSIANFLFLEAFDS